MNSRHVVRSLISGVLLTIALIIAGFRGRQLRYSRRRAFQSQKLERIGEFFRDEIATAKSRAPSC